MNDAGEIKKLSLADSDWLMTPELRTVFAALNEGDIETRAVGGAVRNAMLGLRVSDVDLATTGSPDEVQALAKKAGLKAVPTGLAHGTITVIANHTPFEVTTLRRDVETYGRHASVVFTKDWEEDARRRDFTMNALYAAPDGTVIDPLGGLADLERGYVRFIGNPAERIREDFLRILRFFRFNAQFGSGGFDAEALHACVQERRGLEKVSAERIWAELRRLLIAKGAVAAVQALYDYGLLTEFLGAAPRLVDFERLVRIEASLGVEPEAALRLTALAVFVEEDAGRIGARLRLSKAEQAVLVLGATGPEALRAATPEIAKRLLYRLGAEDFTAYLLLAWARSGAQVEDSAWREAATLPQRWQAPAFPLRGADLTPLGVEGPAIGEVLRRVEAEWVAGGFAEDREALLAKATALLR
jgi:poly(A) polymerase